MGATIATTAVIASTLAGAATTGYSIYSSEKENSKTKKLQKQQQSLLNQEKEEALEERKQQINTQRQQMQSIFGSNYSINQTSSLGRTQKDLLG